MLLRIIIIRNHKTSFEMKKKKEISKKAKLEYRAPSESLTFNVKRRASILYEDEKDHNARIERQLDWIISHSYRSTIIG